MSEAVKMLSDDFAALQQWLSHKDNENDPLQFVLGFALGASPEDLAKQIRQKSENLSELCVHLELPYGAKQRRVPGGKGGTKIITLRGIWLSVDALPQETVTGLFDATLHNAASAEWSETTVTFGAVTGRKLIIKGETAWQGESKTVTYALTVPGGHVFGSISPVGKKAELLNWDENPFEATFSTLRIDENRS